MASLRPRMGVIGTELIEKDQHVHVTLHEPTAEALGCPADYVWSSTGESRIRVVQMTGGGPRRNKISRNYGQKRSCSLLV